MSRWVDPADHGRGQGHQGSVGATEAHAMGGSTNLANFREKEALDAPCLPSLP